MSSTCIKALGVQIDNTFSMQKQVNEVSRASFAKLSNMYKIGKFFLLRMVQRQWYLL